jgi:hypothetical protein
LSPKFPAGPFLSSFSYLFFLHTTHTSIGHLPQLKLTSASPLLCSRPSARRSANTRATQLPLSKSKHGHYPGYRWVKHRPVMHLCSPRHSLPPTIVSLSPRPWIRAQCVATPNSLPHSRIGRTRSMRISKEVFTQITTNMRSYSKSKPKQTPFKSSVA